MTDRNCVIVNQRGNTMFTRNLKIRALALGATLAVAVGLVAVAGGTTGAYFSDTHVTSQNVSIGKVAINDPSSADAAFGNLAPGDSQIRTFTVTNTGSLPENVYFKRGAVTGLPVGDSVPSKLSVGVHSAALGTVTDAANVSPASVLIASAVAPGASFTYTLTVSLDASADGPWNGAATVTIPVKLVGAQMALGWLVVTYP